MAESAQTTNRPLVTVERAVKVLHVLAESPHDLGTNEIARRCGVNASTVSRLLATLAANELVRQVPDTGRYRLGPRLIQLGNAALDRVDLRQVARPHLVALTEATGETATLSVPGEHTVVTVEFVQSPSSVRSVAQVGRPSVPHATAIGKVFLAYGGNLPDATLHPYTPHTLTDRGELDRDVAQVRGRGWAAAVGERERDLNAIAAPIEDAGGRLVAVLGLQGPAGRFELSTMHNAVERLLAHAAQISRGAPP